MYVPLLNTERAYGAISQLFHWLVAVLVVLQFVWAWRIQQLGFGRQRFDLVNEHKSLGLTILALVLLRLLWRSFNRPPPLPVDMTHWERRAAAITHGVLYGLLLALPIVGWGMSSAAGYGASWFGLIHLPDLVAQDQRLMDRLQWLHALLAWTLVLVVAGHALAALRHHFLKRDKVLRRMLPWWNRP